MALPEAWAEPPRVAHFAPFADAQNVHTSAPRRPSSRVPFGIRKAGLRAAHDGGEACVCELTEPLGLTQPTISHHLKILVEAGIFARDKRGVRAYYAPVPSALDVLSAVWARQPLG